MEHEVMKGRDVYWAPPTLPPKPCALIPVEGYVTALTHFQGRMAPVAVLAQSSAV